LLSQLGKLIGDAPQIARINLGAFRITMQLRPNTVEFIFDKNNCSCRSEPDWRCLWRQNELSNQSCR